LLEGRDKAALEAWSSKILAVIKKEVGE